MAKIKPKELNLSQKEVEVEDVLEAVHNLPYIGVELTTGVHIVVDKDSLNLCKNAYSSSAAYSVCRYIQDREDFVAFYAFETSRELYDWHYAAITKDGSQQQPAPMVDEDDDIFDDDEDYWDDEEDEDDDDLV